MNRRSLLDSKETSSLANSIIKEYASLLRAISQIPPDAYELKKIEWTGGKVSVRDVVAYQIGWGTLVLG
jgi:hypothetical protein